MKKEHTGCPITQLLKHSVKKRLEWDRDIRFLRPINKASKLALQLNSLLFLSPLLTQNFAQPHAIQSIYLETAMLY